MGKETESKLQSIAGINEFTFMTEREKEIYLIRQETGKTFTAIANELGIGVSAVSKNYRNAERRIRKYNNLLKTEEYDNNTKFTVELSKAELKVISFALTNMRSKDVRKVMNELYKDKEKEYNYLDYLTEIAKSVNTQITNLLVKDSENK